MEWDGAASNVPGGDPSMVSFESDVMANLQVVGQTTAIPIINPSRTTCDATPEFDAGVLSPYYREDEGDAADSLPQQSIVARGYGVGEAWNGHAEVSAEDSSMPSGAWPWSAGLTAAVDMDDGGGGYGGGQSLEATQAPESLRAIAEVSHAIRPMQHSQSGRRAGRSLRPNRKQPGQHGLALVYDMSAANFQTRIKQPGSQPRRKSKEFVEEAVLAEIEVDRGSPPNSPVLDILSLGTPAADRRTSYVPSTGRTRKPSRRQVESAQSAHYVTTEDEKDNSKVRIGSSSSAGTGRGSPFSDDEFGTFPEEGLTLDVGVGAVPIIKEPSYLPRKRSRTSTPINGKLLCECGKSFEKMNALNGHKKSCKVYSTRNLASRNSLGPVSETGELTSILGTIESHKRMRKEPPLVSGPSFDATRTTQVGDAAAHPSEMAAGGAAAVIVAAGFGNKAHLDGTGAGAGAAATVADVVGAAEDARRKASTRSRDANRDARHRSSRNKETFNQGIMELFRTKRHFETGARYPGGELGLTQEERKVLTPAVRSVCKLDANGRPIVADVFMLASAGPGVKRINKEGEDMSDDRFDRRHRPHEITEKKTKLFGSFSTRFELDQELRRLEEARKEEAADKKAAGKKPDSEETEAEPRGPFSFWPKIDVTAGAKTPAWKAACTEFQVEVADDLLLTAFGRAVPKFQYKKNFSLPRTGHNAFILPLEKPVPQKKDPAAKAVPISTRTGRVLRKPDKFLSSPEKEAQQNSAENGTIPETGGTITDSYAPPEPLQGDEFSSSGIGVGDIGGAAFIPADEASRQTDGSAPEVLAITNGSNAAKVADADDEPVMVSPLPREGAIQPPSSESENEDDSDK
jgi:hypothetical protein